jgi:hypothetical protein
VNRTLVGDRRRQRGQAIVEFTLIAPVLLLLVLVMIDLGRAYFQAIDAAGASRAGTRMAIISDTSDIGAAIRDEPNTGIANTNAVWGAEGPSQPQGTCTNAATTCGDPGGCAATAFTGSQFACFAVRWCTLSGGGDYGTCSSFGPWGQRPQSGQGHGIETKVVIKFAAVTPALQILLGPGNSIYLNQTTVGEELYF